MKILILLSTGYALIQMAHWPIGFTMFTQLSNLFAAAVAACQLARRNRGGEGLATAKLAATASIALTFLVFLLVLAPMEPGGILAAYAQDHYASLCLHLLTPLLTLADFLVNDAPAHRWRRRQLAWVLAFPVGYFGFILILGACGFRWWRGMAAPYPFLNYEAPAGWFGFMPETASAGTLGIGVFYAILAMLALLLLVGAGLLAAAKKRRGAGP